MRREYRKVVAIRFRKSRGGIYIPKTDLKQAFPSLKNGDYLVFIPGEERIKILHLPGKAIVRKVSPSGITDKDRKLSSMLPNECEGEVVYEMVRTVTVPSRFKVEEYVVCPVCGCQIKIPRRLLEAPIVCMKCGTQLYYSYGRVFKI